MSKTADDMDETHEIDAGEADDDQGGSSDPIERYFDAIDDRLEQLYDTTLKPRVEALEADRLKVRGYIVRAAIVAGIPLVLFFFWDSIRVLVVPYGDSSPFVRGLLEYWTLVLVAIAVLAIGFIIARLVMPGIATHLNYRRRFKQDVAADIFKMVMPDGTYQPDHHVTQAVVDESGLFSGRYRMFTGDDLIRGRVGPIEFEASEIKATGTVTMERRRNKRTIPGPNVTQFQGMLFHFGLPRTLKGHTIVEPEVCQGRMMGHRRGFEQITIEDAPFTERFRVYATDAAAATQLLHAGMRARLVAIAEHFSYPPFLAFIGNHVFVAAHQDKPILEPTIAKASSYATVSKIAEFFGLPGLLVRELALDGSAAAAAAGIAEGGFGGGPVTRFATAATGPSILAQQPAVGLVAGDPNTPFTAEALMNMAFDEADEKDAALRPPPASRVQLSPLTGEGLEVSYGIAPSFWIRVLWTLALAPFVIGGLARLAGDAGAPILDAIAAQLPIVRQVADLAAEWPIVFVAIVALFWALPTWSLAHIPRHLRIDRQGVTVGRRLWPFATRCALDRVGGIKVNEAQVLLQRKNAMFLRRFVIMAPTMASREDARWLAAHCRRALGLFGGLRS